MAGRDSEGKRQRRVVTARGTIIAWLVGWPLSALATAFHLFPQVFEQVMLFLSWAAPMVSALDFLTTAKVHQEQGEQASGR